MNGFHFWHPWALLLLAAVWWAYTLIRVGSRKRVATLARFTTLPVARPRRVAKHTLTLATIAVLALAVARPSLRTAPPTPAPSGDVVFLLDVSRSMFTRDVAPNRLQRARQIAREIAGQFNAERVGLIVFAGAPAVVCPLTFDLTYFRAALDSASGNSAPRGGTNISAAIEFAAQFGFDNVRRGRKDLVLLSDGGDQSEGSYAAARELAQHGIRLTAIGIGSSFGAEVPQSEADPSPFLFEDRFVITHLEEASLRKLGGSYWDGGAAFDASDVYRKLAAKAGSLDLPNEDELATWLLAIAAVLLAAERAISERPRVKGRQLAAASLALLFWQGESLHDVAHQAAVEFREGRYLFASTLYEKAHELAPSSFEAEFDLAQSYYKAAVYTSAIATFELAISLTTDNNLKAKCRLGEGNAEYRLSFDSIASSAITHITNSVAVYTRALELDWTLTDARFNREMAQRRFAELARSFAPQKPPLPDHEPERSPLSDDPASILRQSEKRRPNTSAQSVARDW